MVEALMYFSILFNGFLIFLLWAMMRHNKKLKTALESEYVRGQAAAYSEMLNKVKSVVEEDG